MPMDTNRKLEASVEWARGEGPRGLIGALDLGATPPSLVCGRLAIDRATRRAVLAGADLVLTGREYEVLLCLAERANRVVRRSDLLEHVWTSQDDDASNLVAVYIGRLRCKFGPNADMILTVRGVGYRLRPVPDA